MLAAAEIAKTPRTQHPAPSTQHPAPMLAATEIAEKPNLIPIDIREDPYRVNSHWGPRVLVCVCMRVYACVYMCNV